MDLYWEGYIRGREALYGRHFVLVIFIVPVNYIVNEKKYKHTVYTS
jgi:hypothetical protein